MLKGQKQRGKFEDREPIGDDVVRTCKVCNETKQLTTGFLYHATHDVYTHSCRICQAKRRKLKKLGLPLPTEYENPKKRTVQKRTVKNLPWKRTSYFNRKRLDYKVVDKKKGMETDLTVEFIQEAFSSPCIYCGYPAMTLDRVDNNIGHTITNCVPACYECNIARNRIFTFDEMKLLGKCIREIKDNRSNGST